MTKLFAIFMIASVCMFAQEAKPQAADELWEYCVAQSSGGIKTASGNLVGTVAVFYATEQGRREENIQISEPMPQGLSENRARWAEVMTGERAVGKALALLGKDRWELVSVQHATTEGSYFPQKTMYFKRRAR